MQILDGLNFYEFVLLLLGVILFAVILIVLIIYVIQKRPLKGLLAFFILPVVMIGYPGYQKISFDNGVITIEKAQKKLESNPNDVKSRQALENALSNVENKNISNPKTLVDIGKGYAVLGDSANALRFVEKALKNNPAQYDAVNIFNKLNGPDKRIERITDQIIVNPNDMALRRDLENEIYKSKGKFQFNANTYMKMAEVYSIIGDTNKALTFADSLEKKDPNSQYATDLKKRLTRRQE